MKGWRPRLIWTNRADWAEYALLGRDPRIHYLGPLSCWSLRNDKGFSIGRLSFHILNLEELGADW